MDNNLSVRCPEIVGKPSVTIFWFRENSWETTFISPKEQKYVVKHTLKLMKISVYYYLQKHFNVY